MGALTGSIAVRHYRVLDRPPPHFRARYEQAVRVHTLVPLDPQKNPGEERAIGWCSLHDSDDLDLTFDKFWLEGRILLSLRSDVLRPPTRQVRRLLRQRQLELEAERGAPLPRAAVRALKDEITQQLRRTTPPRVRTADMVWHVDEQLLWFFSLARGQNELFQDLFVQTFGIPLDLQGPGTWAEEIARAEKLDEALSGLRPTAELLGGFPGLRPGTRDLTEVRWPPQGAP